MGDTPTTDGAIEPGAGHPRSVSMCSDGRRALVATMAAFAVGFGASFVIDDIDQSVSNTLGLQVMLILLGWNTFAVVYVVLTATTFERTDADHFRTQMRARQAFHSKFWLRVNPWGDGPVFAVEASVVAFVVVLVVPHIRGISINEWLLVPVSLTILLSCWAVSIVSYALQYAQEDLDAPGLDFPGDRTNAWDDYLYFSIAVATTIGATDVSIATPHMRRVANLHTILTFVYNSVIVALLATLLIK